MINTESADICPQNGPISVTGDYTLYRDQARSCAGTFSNYFISIQSANSVSISECLFYDIGGAATTPIQLILLDRDITNCQIIGNCFSQITTSSFLIRSNVITSSNTFNYNQNSFNQITITSSSSADNGVLSSSVIGHNLNIHNNNFSNSNLGQTFAISASRNTAQIKIDIQYCDVFTNTLAGVICDGVRLGSSIDSVLPAISIQHMLCTGNTPSYGPNSINSEYYFDVSRHCVFYIIATNLQVDTCYFANFTVDSSGREMYLFSTFSNHNPTAQHSISVTNSVFTSYPGFGIFTEERIHYLFTGGTYTNNILSSTTFTTVPFSINEYLHDNYINECPIYYTPNTPTSPFSPSNVFTASNPFTASNSFSPSNQFTPQYYYPNDIVYTTIHPVYGAIGTIGTALVSFGVSAIIWAILRNFIIYDHDNFYHIDI